MAQFFALHRQETLRTWQALCTRGVGVFPRLGSCGGMRQSILFKTVMVLGVIAAFEGGGVLGVTHGTEVQGMLEDKTLGRKVHGRQGMPEHLGEMFFD
jgi:hypothetical protein